MDFGVPGVQNVYLLFFITLSLLILLFVAEKRKYNLQFRIMLALILTFEGISITLLSSKIPLIFGLVLVGFGGYFSFTTLRESRPYSENNISSDTIKKLTRDGKYLYLFPVIGFSFALLDILISSFYLTGSLGDSDVIILLTCASWITYGSVPYDYWRERDYIFLFMNLLTLLYVLPSTLDIVFYGTTEKGAYADSIYRGETFFDETFVQVLLTERLESLLSLLGYVVWSEADILYYQDITTHTTASVRVGQSCSGLYSVIIFICAFTSFVLVENKKFDRRVVFLIMFGILIAYVANLLRMAIIVIVGHYYGTDALSWTHTNLGWIIFILWIGIFWSFVSKYYLVSEAEQGL